MIAVTNGPKTRIDFCRGSNDMGHFYPSHFRVRTEHWGWLSLNDYMSKKEFQEFKLEPDSTFTSEQIAEIKEAVDNNKEFDIFETIGKPHLTYYRQMKLELDKSGGNLLWQYNQINSNLDGWTRQVVALGAVQEKHGFVMRRVSLFERKVTIPLFKYICKLLNLLLKPKMKLELRAWKRKKQQMHNNIKKTTNG